VTHPVTQGSSVTALSGVGLALIQWRTFVVINAMLGGELLSWIPSK
jgi:hypothetical protein